MEMLHTSGTTGLPKVVTISQSCIAAMDVQHRIPHEEEQKPYLCVLAEAEKPFIGFPLFHVAGLALSCFLLLSRCKLVFGPPGKPASREVVQEILRVADVDALLLPPSVLEDITCDSTILDRVNTLRYILYGGGCLNRNAGDILSNRTQLLNGIGSTECGSIIQFPMDSRYWNYFRFWPRLNGIEWRETSEGSGEFEMVIVKDDDVAQYQTVFHNFPELSEWCTKDIFAPHPTIKDLWEYRGRTDQLIVFSTGKKLNPIDIESSVSTCSGVRTALVFGNNRPHPGLLVELEAPAESSAMDRIHSEILTTLNNSQKYSSKETLIMARDILNAKASKPFVRSAKGTVDRKRSLELYAPEIEKFYLTQPYSFDTPTFDFSSRDALSAGLCELVGELTSTSRLSAEDDFFAAGLDSRRVQILAAYLESSWKAVMTNASEIRDSTTDLIYAHPTAARLASYFCPGPLESGLGREHDNAIQEMRNLLERLVSVISVFGD
ncbi:uncharacterized protein ATNIH1004_002980 [Aspergillus tanneri]|uniref:AMP-dependent synthetase/ligase domain-containing protein n=1 Tax=Aspergillus tanneri TaxID=1220188 RepID=A0A5M9N6R3_9EURO|nr:uncharacterized protein ATNIH1004_002980 [Aspergillus tanneri]KAA8650297.1 hypothetical protein ATNIH1004_002980 [Aspergillus tanneri]